MEEIIVEFVKQAPIAAGVLFSVYMMLKNSKESTETLVRGWKEASEVLVAGMRESVNRIDDKQEVILHEIRNLECASRSASGDHPLFRGDKDK